MNPFLAMLLSLRIGFVPSPASTAALSIRDEVLQVATNVAERDTFVQREPAPGPSRPNGATAGARITSEPSWSAPPRVHVLQKEDWRNMLTNTLNGNQTLANAAMWLASAPVRMRVSNQKVFVSIAVRVP